MGTSVMQELISKLFPVCVIAAIVAVMTGFIQFR